MPPDSLAQRLERTLRHEIPLTDALGLAVEEWTDRRLVVRAPLQPNLNHKCTAFGGSLYSVAVLAGWGWLWCVLEETGHSATIVIQHSRMEYKAAVEGDIRARCDGASERNLDRFLRTLDRRGRARIDLDVTVDGADDPAAVFTGSYVVITRED